MLATDLPGFEQLREQALTARVVGRCVCGCPSIDLSVDRANTSPAVKIGTGCAATASSQDPRFSHLMLWVDDGYLAGLELAWIDSYPDELPPPTVFASPESG
jgi:hypothetical protein